MIKELERSKFMARLPQKGFTIVELLIVIVVIGILAAIVIVAFTGIQQRANNTKMVTMVGSYTKALATYASQKGTYPGVTGASTADNIACFDGTSTCWTGADATRSSTLKTELGIYTSSFPSAALSGFTYSTLTTEAGPSYTGYYIIFVHRGSGPCPAIGGLTYLNSSAWGTSDKSCRMGLPSPS